MQHKEFYEKSPFFIKLKTLLFVFVKDSVASFLRKPIPVHHLKKKNAKFKYWHYKIIQNQKSYFFKRKFN